MSNSWVYGSKDEIMECEEDRVTRATLDTLELHLTGITMYSDVITVNI